MALTVGWIEGAVVAIDTTARGDAPVAIGTAETGIDRNLLHAKGELLANPGAIVAIMGRIHFI